MYPTPTTPCIEWTGAHWKDGRGQRRIKGRTHYVHRLVWEEANGPIPPGMEVMHLCDNPPCYREDHLQLGTHAENMAMASERGRSNGERHWMAKLTAADIPIIREASAGGETQRSIASRFGVSSPTINQVVKGKTWKRVK